MGCAFCNSARLNQREGAVFNWLKYCIKFFRLTEAAHRNMQPKIRL